MYGSYQILCIHLGASLTSGQNANAFWKLRLSSPNQVHGIHRRY